MTPSIRKVRAVERISRHTYRLKLERDDFLFKAGQCVNVGLPGTGVNREYSSYSAESVDELAFLIREVQGGTVSPALGKLQPGDEVELDGPYGEFTIKDPDNGAKYYFIATGTGVAPFHCFVKTYPQLDYRIIHGVRYTDEQYDAKDYENNRYVGCLSREDGGQFRGRVTDYLRQSSIDRTGIYYLCGNRAMINDVYDILREAGVSGSNIFTETFF